jgi:hypothetical protein
MRADENPARSPSVLRGFLAKAATKNPRRSLKNRRGLTLLAAPQVSGAASKASDFILSFSREQQPEEQPEEVVAA